MATSERRRRSCSTSTVASVGETAGHPTDQPEAAIQPPQQQPSGIRCDDSAIEPGHNLVPFNRFKFEQCWATLCLHRGLSGIAVSDWRIAIFRDSPPQCIKGFEKSGLGGNQVGKAAISGWCDVIEPALRPSKRGHGPVRLWPFDGPLATLLGQPGMVVPRPIPEKSTAILALESPRHTVPSDGRQIVAAKRRFWSALRLVSVSTSPMLLWL